MKKMQIFEPAMCCSTGLCGVGVDPELLRISTVLNTMEKNGVKVDRFNLSNSPQEFVTNKVVNDFIKIEGVEALPITVLGEEIVISGRYPRNEEFIELLNIPMSYVGEQSREEKAAASDGVEGCCTEDNCCTEGDCCSDNSSSADDNCCTEGDCCSDNSSSAVDNCCVEDDCCSDNSSSTEDNCCSDDSCCSGGCC
ncbi:arsenite efflux transporter metallochaperone ArsD [Mobilitalea sibirica]|uniref:Arsenite efflux transporter metallochaperone ArsD n=1 Tax=Mobilitalea sibirica TaxID=1462919 RepID=A0A8J7KZT6_9FIRM|nr:arsenite efflux transporter metallochaperone ArsD [Mobilitalea sibirica]MBH1940938.1 arsenite efflux transporter metallochaperone ArsD [Mobilitalea sibirica]